MPPCALLVYAPSCVGYAVQQNLPGNHPYSPDGVLLDIFWAMGFFKGQTFKLKGNFQRGKGGA